MSTILTQLRQATESIHTDLHSHPILTACLNENLTLDEYRHMLKAFYLPWRELMPGVDSVAAPELMLSLSSRKRALENDLLGLGVKSKFFKPRSSCVLSEDQFIGVAYVLVGSSLGAPQLRDKVRVSLKNPPHEYLSVSPKEAGWKILVGYLDTLRPGAHPEIISSAVSTFHNISVELSKPLVANSEHSV